ncbi:hypothetical protein V8E51_005173 [Hyaloscypha variabilis]
MVKLHSRIRSSKMDNFVTEKVIWVNQLGANFLPSGEHNASPAWKTLQYKESYYSTHPACGTRPVSKDLVDILKSVRSLTKSRVNSVLGDNDYRTTCFGIQHQLERLSLESSVPMQSLVETCIFAAHIYVDLVLLHTRAESIITGEMNGPLQGALIHLSNVRTSRDNDDILLWISATASAVIGAGSTRSLLVAAVIDRFNRVLTRFEREFLYCI